MKLRNLIAGVAFALLGLGAAPAFAAIGTGCVLINTNSTGWPYNAAYACGGISKTDANATALFDTMLNAGSNFSATFGAQNAKMGGKFYLFPTTASANKNLSAQQQLPGSANGATFLTENPDTTPGTTVIVVKPASAFALPVNNVTAHELGHYLDKFNAAAGGGTGSQTLSDTDVYSQDELNYDIGQFNIYVDCTNSGTGLYDNQTDFTFPTPRPICLGAKLASYYASYGTNFEVLTKAWPIFESNDTHVFSEFFAEEFAVITGNAYYVNNRYARQDNYLGNAPRADEFSCSTAVVRSVLSNGKINIYQPCVPYPPQQ